MMKSTMCNLTRLYSSAAAIPKFKTIPQKSTTFKYSELELDLRQTQVNLPDDPAKIAFGTKFTDHMLSVEWSMESGWSKPRIAPFKNIELHPAASVLHYACEVFEGMKAYYGVDKKLRLFRPEMNAERITKSALRSTLPSFDKEEFVQCLKKFVHTEREWIPKSTNGSLYLRPTLIGTDSVLGVHAPKKALFYVIACPTGPYFPSGLKPITLLADPAYVRAFPGGVGNYKCGSNYGPTLFVQNEANKKGCQQVLWLFGKEEYITEAGTMNIFLVVQNELGGIELLTPPLDGTILEGVTRQSIIDLASNPRLMKDADSSIRMKVTQRPVTMNEVLYLLENNRLLEAFGCGTACIVCPIDNIMYGGKKYHIPTMKNGAPYINYFRDSLLKIQYGNIEHEWGRVVEEDI